MVNFFFPHDYDEIFFYANYSHRQAKLFERDCSDNLNISSLQNDHNLDVIDVEKNSIYEHTFIIQEIEQYQVLTKVEEPEDKQFEERRLSKMTF